MRLFPSLVAGTQKPLLGTPIDRDHPLSNGLVNAFAFNEDSGLYLNDSMNSYNAQISSSGAIWASRTVGGSVGRYSGIQFDGSTGYAGIPWNLRMQLRRGLTVTALFTFNGSPPSGQMLFGSCQYPNGFFWNWRFGTQDWFSDGNSTLYGNISDGATGDGFGYGSAAVVAGQTYFGNMVADGVNWKLYLDGVEVYTAADTRLPGGVGTNTYFMGKSSDTNGSYANALLHGVWLHERPLRAEEIREWARRPFAMWEEPSTTSYVFLANSVSTTTGDLIITGSGGTVAMAAATTVTGSIAVTGQVGAVAMTATTNVEGTIAINGSGATLSIIGAASAATGDIAITGNVGAVAMTGDTTTTGNLVITGEVGAVAMTGTTNVESSLAITGNVGAVAMNGTTNVTGILVIDGSGATLSMLSNATSGDVAITGEVGAVAMIGGGVASGDLVIDGSGATVAMTGANSVPGEIVITGEVGAVAMTGATDVAGILVIAGNVGAVSMVGAGAITTFENDDFFLIQ